MCNCRNTKQVETKVIVGTPEPEVKPEPIPTPVEEIDHFNNIDEIKPIKNEETN